MKNRRGATPVLPPVLRSLLLGLLVGATGCHPANHMVIAATGTNIGVDISQDPARQTPQAKLGYQRVEVAIVPTNRPDGKETTGDKDHSAVDTAEVLMELRYSGIFSTGADSGIYQRLAVGKTAVQQTGANFMFARDASGTLTDKAAEAISKATKSLENTPIRPETWEMKYNQLTTAFSKADDTKKQKVRDQISKWKSKTWDEVVDDKDLTEQQIDQLLKLLNAPE